MQRKGTGQAEIPLQAREVFAWVASQSFLEVAGTEDPRALMGEQTLLTLPVGAGGTRVLDQWLAHRGLMVGRRLMCNSWGAVVGMLVEGLGFGFVPRGVG